MNIAAHKPIAAGRQGAGIKARIEIVGVAVIARLIAGLPFSDIDTRHAVAATRNGTVVTACVVIILIRIITSLNPSSDDPITAAVGDAFSQAAIGLNVVAVITILTTFPNMTIAATCDHAAVQAAVGLQLIGVIAFFNADLQHAVTAACD